MFTFSCCPSLSSCSLLSGWPPAVFNSALIILSSVARAHSHVSDPK
jgi:hypothetical protein